MSRPSAVRRTCRTSVPSGPPSRPGAGSSRASGARRPTPRPPPTASRRANTGSVGSSRSRPDRPSASHETSEREARVVRRDLAVVGPDAGVVVADDVERGQQRLVEAERDDQVAGLVEGLREDVRVVRVEAVVVVEAERDRAGVHQREPLGLRRHAQVGERRGEVGDERLLDRRVRGQALLVVAVLGVEQHRRRVRQPDAVEMDVRRAVVLEHEELALRQGDRVADLHVGVGGAVHGGVGDVVVAEDRHGAGLLVEADEPVQA
jgi:hypothetical protein